MIIENIIQIGNPLIRCKSKKVLDINSPETKKTVEDLIDTMRQNNLVGLAAPQVGKNIKIFVTEIRKTPTRDPKIIDKVRVFINPKIKWTSKKEVIIYEACGSVIDGLIFGPVKRPEKVKIEARDISGQKYKLKAEGLLARVIQHEYDHLEGIVFTDKLSDIKKIISKEEYLKKIKY